MWFKINKLVTLLYPQYTKGRTVKGQSGGDGESSFVMPFSQIMAGSPMIRLRIGDVIKTNYSRFNLSRLFGLGTESFAPSDVSSEDDLKQLEAALSKSGDRSTAIMSAVKELVSLAKTKPDISDLRTASSGLKPGDVVRLSYPNVRYLDKAEGLLSEAFGGFAAAFQPPNRFYLPYRDIYAKVTAGSLSAGGLLGTALGNKNVVYDVDLYASFEDAVAGTTKLVNASYKLNHADATIIPAGLSLVREQLKAATAISDSRPFNKKYKDAVNAFLQGGPNGNAVVRAFEESGGKGLPGFVSRVGFNWINREYPWEVDPGSRAPKMVEVSVSFEPTHDIAPGLDHQGYNRAPVYQVGDISNAVAGDTQEITYKTEKGTEKEVENNPLERYNKQTKDITKDLRPDFFSGNT